MRTYVGANGETVYQSNQERMVQQLLRVTAVGCSPYAKAQMSVMRRHTAKYAMLLLMGGFLHRIVRQKRQERLQKEAVLSERAPTQVLHQTYSTLLGVAVIDAGPSKASARQTRLQR